jgi:hypothetical protein
MSTLLKISKTRSIIMGCSSEIGNRHSVCTLWIQLATPILVRGHVISKSLMPLFWIYCFLVHDTDMRRFGCMDNVDWKRIEIGLKQACRCLTCVFLVKVSRGITQCPPSGLEPMPPTSEVLKSKGRASECLPA